MLTILETLKMKCFLGGFFFPFLCSFILVMSVCHQFLPFEGVESKTLKGIVTRMIFALGWAVAFVIILFR